MSRRIKPLVLSLCLLGCISTSAQAAKKIIVDSELLTKILAHEQALEKEVHSLRNKVGALENKLEKGTKEKVVVEKVVVKKVLEERQPAVFKGVARVSPLNAAENNPDAKKQEAWEAGDEVAGQKVQTQIGPEFYPVDVDAPGQSFVTTGPFSGEKVDYSGHDLVVNTPNINQDVTLLKYRKSLEQRLCKIGVVERRPHILLSGELETQLSYAHLASGRSGSDLDVTDAELDVMVAANPWVTGFLTMVMDNAPSNASLGRIANSRLFVNKAFITVGNFDRSPFYASLGQMYVPFGTYSSNAVSSPMTKIFFRTKARAVLLGYQSQNENFSPYASVYGFKGDSFADSGSHFNNEGVNLGFQFKKGEWNGRFGLGYIANLADSEGLQGNFGNVDFGNEHLVHRVPAENAHGMIGYGPWNALVEYISATRRFNPMDMTFNFHGAKPAALNFELAYLFDIMSKPSSVALTYGHSKDALALSLPSKRYSVIFNTSIWKDTLESLEFRHDVIYGRHDFATSSFTPVFVNGVGHSTNGVIFQFDLYF